MRNSKAVFLILLLALVGHNDAWSYPITDTVQYPLDSYVIGANYFGRYNLLDNNKWHLAEDAVASSETNVFAIGNGIVRRAQIQNGYGGTYIIEHNVNGEKVCALYVHMNFATFTKSVGQEVIKGEYLGQVGTREQNGGYAEHLHFGIRKGAYPADPNEYIYGDWIFSGYTANESVLDDWYNPSNFIIAHSSLVGNFSDGSFNDQIVSAYLKHGGQQAFGNPVPNLVPYSDGYVTEWPWLSRCLFQTFDGGDLGNCAIVYDTQNSPGEAFPVHGQLWEYYKANGGPDLLINGSPIGGPIDSEQYAADDFSGNKLVVQEMANGYLVYDTVTGFADARSKDGNDFTIALFPGDGQNLEPFIEALDSSRIHISSNTIDGAAYYEAYLNGQYYGDLVVEELTIEGLQPETTYLVKVVAVDGNGQILAESAQVAVTTKSEIQPEVPGVDFQLWARGNDIEVLLPSVPDSSWCEVYVNGQFKVSGTPGSIVYVRGLGTGTYNVKVAAFSSQGEKIAESSEKQIRLGLSYYTTSRGPAMIGPNYQGEITYTFYLEDESGTINLYRIVSSSDSWLAPDFTTFSDIGIVYPGIPVEIRVPFTTGPNYLMSGKVALAIYAEGQTASGKRIVCHAIHDMKIEPFNDLIPGVAADLGVFEDGEMVVALITVDNMANSICPPSRLNVRVDGALVLSILIPELQAREIWQAELPIGIYSAGNHDVEVTVDPDNEIAEIIEDNNIALSGFTVINATQPNVTITDVDYQPKPAYAGEEITISATLVNNGDALMPAQTVAATLGQGAISIAEVPALAPGESHLIEISFKVPINFKEMILTFYVVADWDNVVEESNEQDNTRALAISFSTPPPPSTLPDLVVDRIEAGRFYWPGWYYCRIWVNNAGSADAEKVGVSVSIPERGWTYSGTITSIRAGSSGSYAFLFNSYTNTVTFGVMVDRVNSVEELDEENNYHEEIRTL